ncbi:hypothetical protein ACJX0J_036267 [Zea mays]
MIVDLHFLHKNSNFEYFKTSFFGDTLCGFSYLLLHHEMHLDLVLNPGVQATTHRWNKAYFTFLDIYFFLKDPGKKTIIQHLSILKKRDMYERVDGVIYPKNSLFAINDIIQK